MKLPLPDGFQEYSRLPKIRLEPSAAGNPDANPLADDEILIRHAFASSPEEGCELLFRRYHRALCSHALRFVYSREAAEDIVSEVFCKIWKNSSFESVTSSYRYYLFSSVRNEAYSYLRAEFTKFDSLETYHNPEASPGQRPDQITQYEETYHRVKELVEQLPPQCRKVFLMNRFEGMRYQEIAEELGLSVKTVDSHLVKAVKLVRSGLREYLSLWVAILTVLSGTA